MAHLILPGGSTVQICGAVEPVDTLESLITQQEREELRSSLDDPENGLLQRHLSPAPTVNKLKALRCRFALMDGLCASLEQILNDLGVRRYKSFIDVLALPDESPVSSRLDPRLDLSTPLTTDLRLKTALPLPSNMTDLLGDASVAAVVDRLGYAIAPRAHNVGEYHQRIRWLEQYSGRVLVTVGTNDLELNYRLACDYLAAGAPGICIDLAHPSRREVYQLGCALRRHSAQAQLIVGNIATRRQAKDLLSMRVGGRAVWNALKIGVGGGSFCSTRVETGIGFPQLDAVRLISYMARRHGVPLISDGAIRMPGHVVIAHVAGASSVMAAGIFDQCTELPHRTTEGKIITRGMASNVLRGQFRRVDPLKASEGVAKIKDPLHSIEQVFDRYEGAIRSALSQLGVFTIADAFRFGRLILVEASTNTENQPTPVGIIGS